MPKINEYINTNPKPVEIVHELKDEKDFLQSPYRVSENSVHQVPTFEEFMKSYERDEKIQCVTC